MRRALRCFWLTLGVVAGTGQAQESAPPIENPGRNGAAVLAAPEEIFELAGGADTRTWGGADYVLWWVRRGPTPPLVVTGSPNDPFPGALDQPGTRVLFGDQGLGYGAFNGLRLNTGFWFDRECTFGVEAGGFVLEQRAAQFNAAGNANGQPFLAAPFVNALSGKDNVYFISQNFANPALSAQLTGGVGVFSTTNLWNWEVHGVANLAHRDDFSAELLVGFRETSLREDLNYTTTATNLTPGGAVLFLNTPIAPGFSVTTLDRFSTANLFNGAQIGARLKQDWGLWTFDVVGKLALGDMHESVTIAGATTTNAPLPVTRAVGGIYAQSSNIGSYSRDEFAVIPEIGLNLSVQLTSHIKAHLGYTFLYLSNVARPGAQIDPQINVNHVPIDFAYGTPGGPSRPAFEMNGTGFWSQGINFGVEFTY